LKVVKFVLICLWLTSAQVLCLEGADFSSAYISEFLLDNQRGLKDDDGEHSGWIELYNPTAGTINLSGWSLTDNRTNLTKWRFPRVGLLPDKYLLVFASGKNRTNDLVHLHTNFRLKKEGGYLGLIGPTTNIISEFSPNYPKQTEDVSYGRVRAEPALAGPMLRPTPGGPNPTSGPGFAAQVAFSRPGGNFAEPFNVQLLSLSSNGLVRYTLDGTLPTSASPVYGAPLRITNTTYIRARSYQEGLFPGPPHSEAYVKLSPNAFAFTSSLPLLVLDTFGKNVAVSSHGSFVHVSVHEPVNGRVSLTSPPTLSTRAGFRVRGSTSSGFPQSPFAVKFVDDFNEEEHLSAAGLPADSDWVLYAPNAYDPVMIHNPFVHQLSRDIGRYSPRTRFVEVFVVRNNGPVLDSDYNGVYVLTEKIKIGKNRVNIDHIGPEDLKVPNVTGGYLLKFDRVGPGESGFFGTGERGLVYVEPKEQTITLPQRDPQREYLKKFFSEFDRALSGLDWKDPAHGYRAYLDVDAAIDFHVLEVLSGNVDAMVLSTYFQKPRNGKIVFGPHWDFDRALGSTDGRDDNPRHWSTGPFFGGEWWPRLFSDVDFWQLWVDRWQELRRTHFSLSNLNGLIDRLCDELREAQPREYRKWGLQPRGGSYQSEIDLMKFWLSNRVDFIDQQLVQPPRLRAEGGRGSAGFLLTITAATNASVYYTLDGSDPRLPQGGISSNALIYARPIELKKNDRIIARARDPNQQQSGGPPTSTSWSGTVTTKSLTTTNQRRP